MASYPETKRMETININYIENIARNDNDQVLLAELRELFESLNEKDKIVFILTVKGYTREEVGKILGVDESRVYQRLWRIRRKIEEYIG